MGNIHDFPSKELGKAVPYGVYDIDRNEAGVTVGISSDTAEFAVAAIHRWWNKLGKNRYPKARRLLITAEFADRCQTASSSLVLAINKSSVRAAFEKRHTGEQVVN